jgi:hypothetical protein
MFAFIIFVFAPLPISALSVNLLATRKGSDGDPKDCCSVLERRLDAIYGSLLIMIFSLQGATATRGAANEHDATWVGARTLRFVVHAGIHGCMSCAALSDLFPLAEQAAAYAWQ